MGIFATVLLLLYGLAVFLFLYVFKERGSLSIFGVSIYSYWREAGHYGQFIIFFLIYITPTCIIFILVWILPAWALIRGISKRQFNMFIPWILSMLLNSSAFLSMMFGFGQNYYPISPLFSYLLSSFVILFLLPVQIQGHQEILLNSRRF